MKVLIVGNGARENAIVEAFSRSKHKPEIVVFADKVNPGIKKFAAVYEVASSLTDFEKLREVASREKPEFAVIGPEVPIAAGAADELEKLGIPSVAPKKLGGQLESSKAFTRKLMQKYEIVGNPDFAVFKKWSGDISEENVMEAMRKFMEALDGQFVVKADGLQGGKGVKVVGDHLAGVADGLHYAKRCIEEDGYVVIEEKLVGEEFSLMYLTDGETLAAMPAVQDHKRAYEDDKGPNTGGMGTYSDSNHSLPFLRAEDLAQAREITEAMLQAVNTETGEKFRGVMYGGFMATKAGVKLIEYNARFGDPEAENVFPILASDFVDVCRAVVSGNLANTPLEFENKATVCKYVVPNGYPENPIKGEEIKVFGLPENCKAYYASVDLDAEGRLRLGGSRAIALVGIADSLAKAERIAEEGVKSIEGPVFHRRDIGTEALINRRVIHMQNIRKQ
jgi:phosphoribosylamine--glycine ligase